MTREEIISAFEEIQKTYLRDCRIPDAKLGISADLWKQHADDHVALAKRVLHRETSGLCRWCEAAVKAELFEIDTTNTPLDAELQLRNQKKMRAEDEGQGLEAVDAAVNARLVRLKAVEVMESV